MLTIQQNDRQMGLTLRIVNQRLFCLHHGTGRMLEHPGELWPGIEEQLPHLLTHIVPETTSRSMSFAELRKSVFAFFTKRYPESDRLLPLCADLEITQACNLRCCHCLYPHEEKENLPLSSWSTVISNLETLGCFALVLSGGEVFAHRDLLGIVAFSKRRGFIVSINSNATMIQRSTAKELADIGVDEVVVSLYGATAATHDRVTSRPGSHAKATRGIEELVAAGVPTAARYVLMDLNADEASLAREHWKSRGVDFRCTALIVCALPGAETTPERFRVDQAHLAEACIEGLIAPPAASACVAGLFRCRINHVGDLQPCELLPTGGGSNLAKALLPAGSVFKPLLANHVRTFVPPECRRCEFVARCSHCPGIAALEHGSHFARSSERCRLTQTACKALAIGTCDERKSQYSI